MRVDSGENRGEAAVPEFPKREDEIIGQARDMIGGYTAHPGVFTHANLAALDSALAAYSDAKAGQTQKRAEAQLATEQKADRLAELVALMRVELKQSEVDTAGDPEQLELIRWAPRATAKPVDAPGQPRELRSDLETGDTVRLVWRSPAAGDGGRVRTYVIERRERPEAVDDATADDTAFTPWRQAELAFDPTVTLQAQPRGQQLEYRIIALNRGGPSPPSNTVAVVL